MFTRLNRCLAICLIMAVILPGLALRPISAQGSVTIEYWNINTATFGGPQVDKLITTFQTANPDIKVESRPKKAYPTLVQDLQTAIAGGNPPDIVQIGWPYLNYVANNLPFVPVEKLLESQNSKDALSDIPKNVYDLSLVNGSHVGLAYSLSNAIVYYNADLFRKAGLDPDKPPTTIQEWTDAAKTFKEKLNLPINAIDYGEDNWAVENLIASNGGSLLVCKDGKYQAGLDTPEAAEALQTWADWVKNGYAVNATDKARQVFWTGDAGSLIWSIGGRGSVQSNAKFDLRATRYPQFGSKPTHLPTGGNMLVIFATDPARQKAAWQFALHLLSKDGITEWTKGTGYVPAIPSLIDDPKYLAGFMKDQPIEQVAASQLNQMIVWTSFPGSDGLAAGRALFEAVQSALGGKATAKDTLAQAATKINGLVGSQTCKGQ